MLHSSLFNQIDEAIPRVFAPIKGIASSLNIFNVSSL